MAIVLDAKISYGSARYEKLARLAARISFFQQLPPKLVPLFLGRMTAQIHPSESNICREGDKADSLAVIMTGTIGVFAKHRVGSAAAAQSSESACPCSATVASDLTVRSAASVSHAWRQAALGVQSARRRLVWHTQSP